MTRIIKSSAAAAIFAAVTVLGSPVAAETRQPTRSITISHADLDITTARGREKLAGRAERAAEQLCLRPGEFDLTIKRKAKKCLNETTQAAEAQIALAVANANAVRLASRGDSVARD